LHLAVDQRTNSLIVAGSRGDMVLVEGVILRLEGTNIRERRNEVYRLKNTQAQDIANALNAFYRGEITILNLGELTPFAQIEREVVVVPELQSNSLIVSATPHVYEGFIRLVERLDAEAPQVVIQVLIAQITLNTNEEFGIELGLQSPVLFKRGLIPF